MKNFLLSILLSCVCLFAGAQSQNASYMKSGGKLRPLQAAFDIRHYTLALNVDIEKQSIGGFVDIDMRLLKPLDTILLDLSRVYTISEITVNGKPELFKHQGDSIIIINKKKFALGNQKVKVSYSGIPPIAVRPPWDGGFTWTKDKSGNPWVVINCQLNGAKIYFPCKDHPSDEPNDGVDLFITIPEGLSVAGPGLLQGVKKEGNDKATWHWKTKYTISNYCVVFNIGKYTVATRDYVTVENNTVPIQYYVLEEDAKEADRVLRLRARDTRVLEKYFGEYPWVKEKIGIAEVPNPGMEHQTMITFDNTFKYKMYRGGLEYSSNLFHEFTHEWWANKITNRDWAHMWIQEGITTYAEALFFKEELGEVGYDSVMRSVRRGIANKKPVVQGEGLDMGEVYNNDIYSKGAFFMHSLRFVIGDEVFFPSLRKFINDVKFPYNRFFETEEVAAFFSKQSGKNLKPLFDFYLRTTKLLDFHIKNMGDDTYQISISNAPMDLPLDIDTDKGVVRKNIKLNSKVPIVIKSKTKPVIDPRGFYFKKVTEE